MACPGLDTKWFRPWSTCILRFVDGSLAATLDHGDGHSETLDFDLTPEMIVATISDHRVAFETPEETGLSGPFDLWNDATDRFLATVYHQISAPLAELVGGLAAVELRFGHDLLTRLPIESAHDGPAPALLERTRLHRAVPPMTLKHGPCCQRPPGRRFRLSLATGDERCLVASGLERLLVSAAHRQAIIEARWPSCLAGPVESVPLVHLVGHDPAPMAELELDRGQGGTHLVLSGCDSLLSQLPPTVTSAACSLWPVDDTANVTFMASYHARLAAGIGPAEALRQAQLLHRSLPTMAWAAYVHVGCPI